MLLEHCDGFDFYAGITWQACDLNGCARWRIALELLAIHFVHRVVIIHISEKYRRLHDVLDTASRRFEHRGQVREHLLKLCFEPALRKLSRLWIQSDLTGSED